jgi:hypothetical protein
MKTQKPKQPRTNSPNSRRLTAAVAALLLSAPTSTFAQSQNAEQPARQPQQPAAGGFSQPADGAAAGGFGQAAPSGQLQQSGSNAGAGSQQLGGGFQQGSVQQPQGFQQGPVRQQQQAAPADFSSPYGSGQFPQQGREGPGLPASQQQRNKHPELGTGPAGGAALIGNRLPKVPDKLEEMLALALRSNPEILLAESKLRQAQSELNQVRLKVTEEVVSLYYERRKQEELSAQLNQQLKVVQAAFRAGEIPSEKVIEAMIARSNAAAAVPQIEAQTRYLLGLGGDNPTRYLLGLGGDAPGSQAMRQAGARSEVVTTLPRPEMPEKFRKILDMPASFEFEDTRLELALEYFSTEYKTRFLIDAAATGEVGGESPITLRVDDFTLLQALQAILDVGFSDARGYRLCFVIRDYGILVSTPERARKLYGATIPPELPMDASAVPPAERQ